MDSAVAGLIGALIGSIASAVGVFLAQREETKRKLVSDLVNAGMKQWEAFYRGVVEGVPGTDLYPPEVYVMHLVQIAPLLAKADKLSDEELAKEFRRKLAKIHLVCNEFKAHKATRETVAHDCAGNGRTWTEQ